MQEGHSFGAENYLLKSSAVNDWENFRQRHHLTKPLQKKLTSAVLVLLLRDNSPGRRRGVNLLLVDWNLMLFRYHIWLFNHYDINLLKPWFLSRLWKIKIAEGAFVRNLLSYLFKVWSNLFKSICKLIHEQRVALEFNKHSKALVNGNLNHLGETWVLRDHLIQS